MSQNLLTYCILIFAAAFLGGLITLFRRWSDELLHMFVSFGAGIFIGTVFLSLLPEALSYENSESAAIFILIGFMLIFFIEKFLFARGNNSYDYNHMVISIAALVGLSLHSFIAGLGLTVGAHFPGLGSVLFIAIIAHKTTAAFSLTSLFLLAKMSTKKSLLFLTIFSLMTPLGALLMEPFISGKNSVVLLPLMGLTTGTFLYVTVGELLPEVFHTKHNRWLKLLLLIIGIIVMGFLGDSHH
ncbi:MAG: ZIP family metal transporter [Candidatus Zixiibacteriota bacterium]